MEKRDLLRHFRDHFGIEVDGEIDMPGLLRDNPEFERFVSDSITTTREEERSAGYLDHRYNHSDQYFRDREKDKVIKVLDGPVDEHGRRIPHAQRLKDKYGIVLNKLILSY